MSGNIFGCNTWTEEGALLVSSGWRLGMLLNMQCRGTSAKTYLAQMPVVLRLTNPDPYHCFSTFGQGRKTLTHFLNICIIQRDNQQRLLKGGGNQRRDSDSHK